MLRSWLFETAAGPVLGINRDTARGPKLTYYRLAPLPSDWGRAFRLRKCGGEAAVYQVCLDGDTGVCECVDYLRHGHNCKHILALLCLVEAGRL